MTRRESGGLSGVPTPSSEAEGDTDCAASARRSRTPRGRRPRARTEAPRTGTGRSRVCPREREPRTASGSRRTYADDERTREVGRPRSTGEVAEQSRGTGGGGDGGKGAGQGEPEREQRAPDAEPDQRAKRPRAGTSGSTQGQEAAVHGAPASRLRGRAAAGGLPGTQAGGRAGHRWGDVAALRRGPGSEPPGLVRTAAARGVPGEAGSESVHPEGGRAAAAARCPRAGGQDSPARRRRGPERHLRDRLPGGSRTGSGRGTARTRHWMRSQSACIRER